MNYDQFNYQNQQMKKILIGIFIILVICVVVCGFYILPVLSRKYYAVIFRLNNGSENVVVQVQKNKLVSQIENPTMDNYVFVGWALEDEFYNFNTAVTSNITLEAIWYTKEELKEIINDDDNHISDSNSSGSGELSNSEIIGGSNSSNSSGESNDFVIPDDVVVPIVHYQVAFDSNGGSAVEGVKVIHNGLAEKPQNPIKSGYRFLGWKLNGVYYDFSSKVVDDITLLAVWEKIDNDIIPSPSSTPSNTPTVTVSPLPTTTPKPTSTPSLIPVTKLILSHDNLLIEKGKSLSLSVSYTPNNANLTKLTWTSSNTNVAVVDSSGKIVANGVGTAVITVKDDLNNYAQCNITVIQKPISLSFNDTTITLKKGSSRPLSLTFYPNDTTEKNVTWKSNNPNVVTVNNQGVVTAVGGGSTTINAITDNGRIATIEIVVDSGQLELLKDTKFNNGFELWMDANEKNYKCINCKGQQYWYIASWGFPPKFVNSYQENGNYFINANQSDGTNTKLITYNNKGELSLALNTFGISYSDSAASGWPHLLLDGMAGTNNKFYDFYSYSPLEQKYYSFTGNNIWYHVAVRLDYYNKGNPINGVQAAQYLSYIELRDKVTKKMIWFGFNLFDDRASEQKNYVSFDLYTQNYIYSLGTDAVYNGASNSIYHNGDFVYNTWKEVNINLSNYIDDIVRLANEKQIFGRTITQDDLFIGAVNIGFEIHGEYHIGMSMKDLQITSIER